MKNIIRLGQSIRSVVAFAIQILATAVILNPTTFNCSFTASCNAFVVNSSPRRILSSIRITPIGSRDNGDGDDKNKSTNKKSNYSPYQASWKEAKQNDNEKEGSKKEFLKNLKNMKNPIRVPNFELPTIEVPKIPQIELPTNVGRNIESNINDFTGEVDGISKRLIEKIANGGDYYLSELQGGLPDLLSKITSASSSSTSSASSSSTTSSSSYLEALPTSTNGSSMLSSSIPKTYSPYGKKFNEEVVDSSMVGIGRRKIESGVNQFGYFSQGVIEKIANGPKEAASEFQRQYIEARKSSVDIDQKIKSKVNGFTGDEDYQIGNISKAIVRKIATKEYDISELTLLFRILLALGADLSVVTGFLPFAILVQTLNLAITLELGEKLVTAFSVELNKRVDDDRTSIDDNQDTQQGKTTGVVELATNNSVTMSAMTDITGKKNYKVGDLTAAISNDDGTEVDLRILEDLEECLAMEKALLKKLGTIRSAGASIANVNVNPDNDS